MLQELQELACKYALPFTIPKHPQHARMPSQPETYMHGTCALLLLLVQHPASAMHVVSLSAAWWVMASGLIRVGDYSPQPQAC